MIIYILCYNEDIDCVSDKYVTDEKDIKQLAIDHYWGTLTEPEPGRLMVTVDMTLNVVTLMDNRGGPIEYNILAFDKRES